MKYVGIVLLALLSLFAAYIITLCVSACIAGAFFKYGTNSGYYRFLLYSSTAIGLFILRVKVHISGLEKLPAGKRFMLVCNHRSNYDPIVTWHAMRKYDLAFISKSANFKIPVFGQLIRGCAFLPIDRSSPKSSAKTLTRAAELMKNGEVSFGIYPEGTRSKTCELLPFHAGVFTLAKKAEVPIAVMTLRGTEKICKNYIRRRTDVYLDIVEVIPDATREKLRSGELSEIAKNIIYTDLEGDTL